MPQTRAPKGTISDPVEPPFVGAGDDDALRLPNTEDLLEQLHFSLHEGRITLGSERMVLLHVRALATLREGIIDVLGIKQARALLLRVGYTSGYHDARQSKEIRRDSTLFELLSAGPQLHALEGMAAVRPLELRFDHARGEYYGEFLWRNSAEAQAAMMSSGVSASPTCWILLGYATGYTSGFMGRPVLYREVSCRGCGARSCKIVGRPIEEWRERLEGFEFLYEDPPPAPEEVPSPPVATSLPKGLIGRSPTFVATWSLIEAVAPTTTPVLLHGEIGSGRSTLANAIHRLSPQRGQRVAIGAGHGGADAVTKALERAAGGTLVLDDLDVWDPISQRRLLEHLDDNATPDAHPRWVVTMIRDPEDPAHSSLTTRLLYRLGSFPIHVPPLRDRSEDIIPLADQFRKHHSTRLEKALAGFTTGAQRALLEHSFPGNLHELANVVERAAIVVKPGVSIDVGHLFGGVTHPTSYHLDSGRLRRPEPDDATPPLDLGHFVHDALDHQVALEAVEEALIRGAVERVDGNLAAAARTLGLTRAQLAYRFNKLPDRGAT